jgi:hypothetical protein
MVGRLKIAVALLALLSLPALAQSTCDRDKPVCPAGESFDPKLNKCTTPITS